MSGTGSERFVSCKRLDGVRQVLVSSVIRVASAARGENGFGRTACVSVGVLPKSKQIVILHGRLLVDAEKSKYMTGQPPRMSVRKHGTRPLLMVS
jgi:hypothetical protein